ncbi:MAG: putative FMNH2-utilizing oxygenase, partial [uncultured Actinomycetospora sp.]
AEADPPRRPLPRGQQHHGLERPGVGQPHRVRVVPALRADRGARQVRLPLPRRGPAPARAGRADLRPRRHGPPRQRRDPAGAGRRHRADRPGRHGQLHVQRAARRRPQARDARPPLRRAGGLERGHELGRVHRRELPPRRLPAQGQALPARPGDARHRPGAVGLVGRRRGRRRRRGGPVRAPRGRRAVRHPLRPVRHLRALPGAAQPAGPSGDHPGRRLGGGPRVRRLERRRDLHPARRAGGRAAVLRRREGPAGEVRPAPRGPQDPAGGDVRARGHRVRGRGERAAGAVPAGRAGDGDRVRRAGVEPRPLRRRPRRPGALVRPEDLRRRRLRRAHLQGPRQRADVRGPRGGGERVARARRARGSVAARGRHPQERAAHVRRDPAARRGHDRRVRADRRLRRLRAGPARHAGRAGRVRRPGGAAAAGEGLVPHRVRGHDAARAPRPPALPHHRRRGERRGV